MATAAMGFTILGVLVVGFGVYSLSNLVATNHEEAHTDRSNPRFRMFMVKFIWVGAALLTIGALLRMFV
tara:strand:+ start:277 stop:483 length:207 start_codon:yes stop_codon:yes gene_type:complete